MEDTAAAEGGGGGGGEALGRTTPSVETGGRSAAGVCAPFAQLQLV